MKRVLLIAFLAVLLTGCVSETLPTSTSTPEPTVTPEPTPTPEYCNQSEFDMAFIELADLHSVINDQTQKLGGNQDHDAILRTIHQVRQDLEEVDVPYCMIHFKALLGEMADELFMIVSYDKVGIDEFAMGIYIDGLIDTIHEFDDEMTRLINCVPNCEPYD